MTVYLLHFHRRYKHGGHYLGSADDLAARLARHAAGHGARLLAVAKADGITWELARTWPGGRTRERQIKNQGGASRYCPLCGIRPRPPKELPAMTGTTTSSNGVPRPPRPERDDYGRYLLPHPGTGEIRPWTRVTTWAKTLSDTTALARWQARMTARGITLRPDLYALAAAAPGDTTALDELCRAAREAAAAQAGANLGTALHKFTERADLGQHPDVPEPWDADLTAYRAALAAAGITIDPAHVERVTVVPELGVAGTLDRIAHLPGAERPVIADVKTAANLAHSWGEIAIQLACYAHGAGLWNGAGYDPMPEVDRDRALVIHLPAGQARCELHWIDIAAGWHAAQLCLQVRAWRARRDHATPCTPAPQDAGEGVRADG